MIFGNPSKTLPLLALLTIASAVAASAGEIDALVQRLARPAPATIAFTEVRFSQLLKAPLIVSGELGYEGAQSLSRRVLAPYRETTAIRGDAVRVEREGEKPRTFASARAPELRNLLDSFNALLAGDAAALTRSFDATVRENAQGWRLELKPKDARARRRVRDILITGAANEPRCVTISNVDGGASVIVLGEQPADLITPSVTREALQAHCEAVELSNEALAQTRAQHAAS